MSATSSPAGPRFSRADPARGLGGRRRGARGRVHVGPRAGRGRRSPTSRPQALAAQVGVQEALVAAYAAAGAADPAVTHGRRRARRARRRQQLEALQAAAPGEALVLGRARAPAAPRGRCAGLAARQVAATATSHATACLDQTGARAALLGSIAAGLRGQDRRLA